MINQVLNITNLNYRIHLNLHFMLCIGQFYYNLHYSHLMTTGMYIAANDAQILVI